MNTKRSTTVGRQYADDPERIHLVFARLLTALGAVLLHPPSDATKQVIARDREHLTVHLEAGPFVDYADDFGDEFPVASRVWVQLKEFYVVDLD